MSLRLRAVVEHEGESFAAGHWVVVEQCSSEFGDDVQIRHDGA